MTETTIFYMETETNDTHVCDIRKEFEKCQKIDKNDTSRVYTGENINKVLIFFNTGIGGICLDNIVDIDCNDISTVFIMQKGGYTHMFLYDNIDKVIIKFNK